jgi:hypothetical protein
VLTILFTAAGIVIAALIGLAVGYMLALVVQFADDCEEQQLRDDLADSARAVDHCGWVEAGANFHVHPSAADASPLSHAGDSRGASLSSTGSAPVSDLLHSTGDSREEPHDHA